MASWQIFRTCWRWLSSDQKHVFRSALRCYCCAYNFWWSDFCLRVRICFKHSAANVRVPKLFIQLKYLLSSKHRDIHAEPNLFLQFLIKRQSASASSEDLPRSHSEDSETGSSDEQSQPLKKWFWSSAEDSEDRSSDERLQRLKTWRFWRPSASDSEHRSSDERL